MKTLFLKEQFYKNNEAQIFPKTTKKSKLEHVKFPNENTNLRKSEPLLNLTGS